MQITHYRIKNFRSIVDTGWQRFSRDGVTVLVGQNESGKTSVLDALAMTFTTRIITADDVRSGDPLPSMYIRFECEFADFESELSGFAEAQIEVVRQYWETQKNQIVTQFIWKPDEKDTKNPYIAYCELADAGALAEALKTASKNGSHASQPSLDASTETGPVKPLTLADLGGIIYELAPTFVLFNERTGTLPNEIELDEKNVPTGNGARAAQNYLTASEIELPKLLKADRRTRESTLLRANTKLTSAFNSFWSQTIGKETKLSLACEIQFHNADKGTEMAGKAHLVFWISDGHTRLYPSQRSKGVRWFVSFFLQMLAAKTLYGSTVFLLDEPGASLHSKAQADVLKLINVLREEIPIVYSTHSPDLIEYEHLHRIHAVQRTGDADDSPTTILDAHRLGAASSDTLSPILTAMGTNLSNQQTIQKRNNVLVEEVSGFYYFSAFWKLVGEETPAYFIASTGVNKLPALANLFVGWGLDFITVVDDDNQGRGVYKELVQDLYGGDVHTANRFIIKLKECDGIEDIFSTKDFKRYVLKDEAVNVQQNNSEFLKRANRSKPILALEFKLAVDKGKVQFVDLDEATQSAIKETVESITKRLGEPIAKAAESMG